MYKKLSITLAKYKRCKLDLQKNKTKQNKQTNSNLPHIGSLKSPYIL